LAEKREALSEQESSVQKQWDDLFTLLTANFEQIIIGLRNVETAVRALNRGIKRWEQRNRNAEPRSFPQRFGNWARSAVLYLAAHLSRGTITPVPAPARPSERSWGHGMALKAA